MYLYISGSHYIYGFKKTYPKGFNDIPNWIPIESRLNPDWIGNVKPDFSKPLLILLDTNSARRNLQGSKEEEKSFNSRKEIKLKKGNNL